MWYCTGNQRDRRGTLGTDFADETAITGAAGTTVQMAGRF